MKTNPNDPIASNVKINLADDFPGSLTKREHFASQIIGHLAGEAYGKQTGASGDSLANMSVNLADALIRRLNEENKTT